MDMCSLLEADTGMSNSQLNETNFWQFSQFIPDTLFTIVTSMLPNVEYHPWVFSMIGSTLIGLSGVFPLLVIPIEEGANLKNGAGAHTLKVLLSFAVGCLLGDVFLHLLPEVWERTEDSPVHPCMEKGLWVLAGLLIFVFLEKAFALPPTESSELDTPSDTHKYKVNGFMPSHNNNHKGLVVCDNNVLLRNGHSANHETDVISVKPGPIHVSGYLNLMANSFDNFTHGLAVGGSFLVSFPHGVLTTFAILLHEIPHEVGDFAILLKSGFSRWEAAKAQLCTATAGIFGALVAIILSGSSGTVAARTSWILPFTAGGFLHIALVTVLPDLLKEENPKESMLQLLSLLGGITVMATMSFIVE